MNNQQNSISNSNEVRVENSTDNHNNDNNSSNRTNKSSSQSSHSSTAASPQHTFSAFTTCVNFVIPPSLLHTESSSTSANVSDANHEEGKDDNDDNDDSTANESNAAPAAMNQSNPFWPVVNALDKNDPLTAHTVSVTRIDAGRHITDPNVAIAILASSSRLISELTPGNSLILLDTPSTDVLLQCRRIECRLIAEMDGAHSPSTVGTIGEAGSVAGGAGGGVGGGGGSGRSPSVSSSSNQPHSNNYNNTAIAQLVNSASSSSSHHSTCSSVTTGMNLVLPDGASPVTIKNKSIGEVLAISIPNFEINTSPYARVQIRFNTQRRPEAQLAAWRELIRGTLSPKSSFRGCAATRCWKSNAIFFSAWMSQAHPLSKEAVTTNVVTPKQALDLSQLWPSMDKDLRANLANLFQKLPTETIDLGLMYPLNSACFSPPCPEEVDKAAVLHNLVKTFWIPSQVSMESNATVIKLAQAYTLRRRLQHKGTVGVNFSQYHQIYNNINNSETAAAGTALVNSQNSQYQDACSLGLQHNSSSATNNNNNKNKNNNSNNNRFSTNSGFDNVASMYNSNSNSNSSVVTSANGMNNYNNNNMHQHEEGDGPTKVSRRQLKKQLFFEKRKELMHQQHVVMQHQPFANNMLNPQGVSQLVPPYVPHHHHHHHHQNVFNSSSNNYTYLSGMSPATSLMSSSATTATTSFNNSITMHHHHHHHHHHNHNQSHITTSLMSSEPAPQPPQFQAVFNPSFPPPPLQSSGGRATASNNTNYQHPQGSIMTVRDQNGVERQILVRPQQQQAQPQYTLLPDGRLALVNTTSPVQSVAATPTTSGIAATVFAPQQQQQQQQSFIYHTLPNGQSIAVPTQQQPQQVISPIPTMISPGSMMNQNLRHSNNNNNNINNAFPQNPTTIVQFPGSNNHHIVGASGNNLVNSTGSNHSNNSANNNNTNNNLARMGTPPVIISPTLQHQPQFVQLGNGTFIQVNSPVAQPQNQMMMPSVVFNHGAHHHHHHHHHHHQHQHQQLFQNPATGEFFAATTAPYDNTQKNVLPHQYATGVVNQKGFFNGITHLPTANNNNNNNNNVNAGLGTTVLAGFQESLANQIVITPLTKSDAPGFVYRKHYFPPGLNRKERRKILFTPEVDAATLPFGAKFIGDTMEEGVYDDVTKIKIGELPMKNAVHLGTARDSSSFNQQNAERMMRENSSGVRRQNRKNKKAKTATKGGNIFGDDDDDDDDSDDDYSDDDDDDDDGEVLVKNINNASSPDPQNIVAGAQRVVSGLFSNNNNNNMIDDNFLRQEFMRRQQHQQQQIIAAKQVASGSDDDDDDDGKLPIIVLPPAPPVYQEN